MPSLLFTTRERFFAVALLVVWALLYLPNLRTNPNWYSDEGEVMEMCSTTISGQSRVGPLRNDFLFPFPYPPFYLGVTGGLLRVFGGDLVVARGFGAVAALATAVILFWIGSLLRDRSFGFLCAAAFLVYPEAVMNWRWARPHPLAGTLSLACIGFLIRYVQEKRWNDLLWSGIFCSLASATIYFTYPLIVVVIVTAAIVNRRHLPLAMVSAGAYGLLFVAWYVLTQVGGITELIAQLQRATAMAGNDTDTGLIGLAVKVYRNIVTFVFLTPTLIGERGSAGVDIWLILAALGTVFFPVRKFRVWLWFWLLAMMCIVFKTRDNIPIFFYPACVFLPLLALGFASALTLVGSAVAGWFGPKISARPCAVFTPGIVILVLFGASSLSGSLGHFQTKVDIWTVQSPANAEATSRFINENTTSADFVIVPKHLYWLVTHARKSMLTLSPCYDGNTNEMWPTRISIDRFWFDCRWSQAKYLVLAYGQTTDGRTYGFDAVYTLGLRGMREIIGAVQAEKWPVVFRQGEFMVLANPRFEKSPER